MRELVDVLKSFGAYSLDNIWFPVLVWTICCIVAFLFLRYKNKLNPLFQYHLRVAALLSLPLGILVSILWKSIPGLFSASAGFEPAFFVVYNPIEVVSTASSAQTQAINWVEPNFLIGLLTLLVLFGSVVMIGLLVKNYFGLRTLYKNFELTGLEKIEDFGHRKEISQQNILLAFHDHPLVPFTFGWKKPIIVLPELLKDEPDKMEMALQHEITHIKRGDYLLHLAISMIESLFWFHPLVQYGSKEIDTYREISCDQEVLSKSDFPIKSYANLLYELVPLNSGLGRLSVSMAVHNSTLKQRIKTMKYHKLYRSSFKQSILFLILMVIGIIFPIACSDLRGPGNQLNPNELENLTFQIENPKIEVNGKQIQSAYSKGNITSHGNSALLIGAGDYGSIAFSPRQIGKLKAIGKIDGNELSFTTNNMNFKVTSEKTILEGVPSTTAWVHLDTIQCHCFTGFSNAEDMEKTLNRYSVNMDADVNLDDFFVVVEEMPEPIDGVKAIQSKVQYPQIAKRAGIEGRVTVEFVVNEKGEVERPEVIRGIGGGCDEEALRVIRETKFKPGYQRGKPVRVQFALSINFELDNSDFSAPPPPTQSETSSVSNSSGQTPPSAPQPSSN